MLDRNLRGIDIALCLLTLLLSLSGCGSLKDDTLLIANAVITEIDTEKQTITVKDDVDESTLGEECLLDVYKRQAMGSILYAGKRTGAGG